jgi:hypothetical protein
MPESAKITLTDYYELYPSLIHHAGDIWSDVPCRGLAKTQWASGIVVTPACDLAHRKADTLTFLSIFPVRMYFLSPAYQPEIAKSLLGQLQAAQCVKATFLKAIQNPHELTNSAIQELSGLISGGGLSTREKSALTRAIAGFELLGMDCETASEDSTKKLELLLGEKDFLNLTERIVGNSHRGDIHFLPPDCQQAEWSGIVQPSVVMFRHASSLPVSLFDKAQELDEVDWAGAITRLGYSSDRHKHFSQRRPLKRLTLKSRFYADLMTRYVGMCTRLGAPDFSDNDISKYVSLIRGL